MNYTMQNAVMLVDADNTLWDTDGVFANAQLALLTEIEALSGIKCPEQDRLAYVRRHDQALAAVHHQHLKYPIQMLGSSLLSGLNGQTAEDAATALVNGRATRVSFKTAIVDRAISHYADALGKIPELLPSVIEGLQAAWKRNISIIVLTEGRIEKQRSTIEAHHLGGYFSGVWEVKKDREQFERLCRRFDGALVVVIGDQPDRDIVPAKQAGCMAVLVPSRFRPSWRTEADEQAADFVAENFSIAIKWSIDATDGDYPTRR
ncbi:HAD family hydrolase [Variovorax humicola]|uniref:HAD family hydrolase n=1 Tax=Variovorax humicola TaxID=1769758 RepID=A0ABU8W2L1_9BURK